MTKLEHALDAASRGLRVFPQTGKVPGIKGWPDNASSKPSVIERWWARRPDADIGIALDADLYVLDADSDEAYSGMNGLTMHRTLSVKTARGEHRYFRLPAGELRRVSGDTGVCGIAGLEGKGRPGPVTWAGSVHPSGFVYRVVVDAPIAMMPYALLSAIGYKTARASAGEATAAERAEWSAAHEAMYHGAGQHGLSVAGSDCVREALTDMRLISRQLRADLPELGSGWADRLFRAGTYLGSHVATGSFGLDEAIGALEMIFRELDTDQGPDEHCLRSIRRGVAEGAREATF